MGAKGAYRTTRLRVGGLAMPAVLMVAACGGDGTDQSPGGSTWPIETPGPTPSPAPTYAIGLDLAVDQKFSLYSADSRELYEVPTVPGTGINRDISTDLRAEGSDILQYRAADQSVTMATGSRILPGTAFTGSEVASRQDGYLNYRRAESRVVDDLTISRPGPMFGAGANDMRYMAVGLASRTAGAFGYNSDRTALVFTENRAAIRFVAGSKTIVSDIPTSGTVRYSALGDLRLVAPSEAGSGSFKGGDAAFGIDFTTNTISGSLAMVNSQNPGATLTLAVNGQVNRETGEVRGSMASPAGYSASFVGRLFGPTAREIGFVFTLSRGAENGTGTVVAVRR